MTRHTNTLIVGAGMSGLAVAAALQKKGIDYIIIEKQELIGMAWRKQLRSVAFTYAEKYIAPAV
jgi:cation diffusion facilitator CzcD-associated flavoprotein CzcO